MPLFEHDIVREAQALAGDIVAHLTATAARVDEGEAVPSQELAPGYDFQAVYRKINNLQDEGYKAALAHDRKRFDAIRAQMTATFIEEKERTAEKLNDLEELFTQPSNAISKEELDGIGKEIYEWKKHWEDIQTAHNDVGATFEEWYQSLEPVATAGDEPSEEAIEVEPMSESEGEPKKKPDTAPWPAVKDDEDPTTKPNPVTSLDGLEQNPRTSEEIIQQAVDRILALKYKYAEEEKAILAQGESDASQEPLVSIEQIVDPKDTEAAVAATKRKHGLL